MPDKKPRHIEFLLLCTKFHRDSRDRYLSNDLADALVQDGVRVTVCLLEWSNNKGGPSELVILPNGVEVLYVPPIRFRLLGRRMGLLVKWLASSVKLAYEMRRLIAKRRISYVFCLSPLVTVWAAIIWTRRQFHCLSYAYITDFFPYHHRAIGLVGAWSKHVGAAIEAALMRRFDTVACMSLAGTRYLQSNYRLRKDQKLPILQLWAENDPLVPADAAQIRERYGLPLDRPIAIFGGQISEGRGIEDILSVARIAADREPSLLFLLIGEGRLEPLVRSYIAEGRGNLVLHGRVTGNEYLRVAQACDVGLVATVANSGVPTFPSKTLEYLRAGLPIAASVESTTDYGAFLKDHGIGLAVPAGDYEAFLSAIILLCRDQNVRRSIGKAQGPALDLFSVKSATRDILGGFDRDA